MTRDEVRQSFIELLRSVAKGVDPRSVTDATSLITDLGIDSVRMVDIVLETEDKFGIEIESDAMDKLYTVGGAVEMILKKKTAAA